MTPIQELQLVIRKVHRADTQHLESVPVTERHMGKVVWNGIVEVFRLRGHPQTNRVYGWVHDTGECGRRKRFVTVLHIPPVVSPQTAVQAAIVQDLKDREPAKTELP